MTRAVQAVARSTDLATRYARDVVKGRIVAGELQRFACQRHLEDLDRSADSWPWRWRWDRVEHFLSFVRLLRHFQGRWAGKAFELAPWQIFGFGSIFGWVNDALERRFLEAYFEVARKNGKTTGLSAIDLYMLLADGEHGAQVYSAATKERQARLLVDAAEGIARRSPALKGALRFRTNRITHLASSSYMMGLGRDSKTEDGLNVHCASVDELHAHPTSEMWDVLDSATGSRTSPLMAGITTAGFDVYGYGKAAHDSYVRIVTPGSGVDLERVFVLICALDDPSEAFEEAAWPKANPSLGITVELEQKRAKASKAQAEPMARTPFLVKEMNLWQQTGEIWIESDLWDANAGELDWRTLRQALLGEPCVAGLDLSATEDLTALGLWFPSADPEGLHRVLAWYWMPEDLVDRKTRSDRLPYRTWRDQGVLQTTPGEVIDIDVVERKVRDVLEQYDVQEFAYDPWNSRQLGQRLDKDGVTAVQTSQGYRLSESIKLIRRLVGARRFAHGGDPLLRACVGSVQLLTDPEGRVKLNKSKRGFERNRRIDGVAALATAGDRIVRRKLRRRSCYEPDIYFAASA